MFFSIIAALAAVVGAVVILQEISHARAHLASKMDRAELHTEAETVRKEMRVTEQHLTNLERELRKQTMTRSQMEAKINLLDQRIRSRI